MSQEPPQRVGNSTKLIKDPTPASPRGSEIESHRAESNSDQGSTFQSSSPKAHGSIGRIISLFILLAVVASSIIGTASWWFPHATMLVQGLSKPSGIVSGQPSKNTRKVETLERLQTHPEALEVDRTSTANSENISPAGDKPNNRLQVPERLSHTDEAPIITMSDSLSSQAQQLASFSARLSKLESETGNTARMEDINSRISALEKKSANAASVLNLSNRMTALEDLSRRAGAEQAAKVALLLTTAQLRVAVTTGQPFALELATANVLSMSVLGTTINDEGFANYINRGIPTLFALQQYFDETASQIIRAAVIPDEASGWLRQSLDRIMAIVTVRRVNGGTDSKGVSAILARAENHLKAGDLKSVTNEMAALTGASAEAAAPWLTNVNARIDAEQAVNTTLSKAMALMAVDEHTKELSLETADTE